MPDSSAEQWKERAGTLAESGDRSGALRHLELAALESHDRWEDVREWALEQKLLTPMPMGQPIAEPPLVPDFGPAAAVPGGRAQKAPASDRFLVRTRAGWQCVEPGAAPGTVLASSDSPATWVFPTRVAVGRGKSLVLMDTNGGNEAVLQTFDRRVSSLLGPVPGDRPRIAVCTGGGEPHSPDLYLVDLEGDARFLKHLVLDLVHDTVRWERGLLCIGTGVQSSEIRLVWADDGRWQTRTIHQHPLRVVVECSDRKVATVDKSGTMLFWEDSPPHPTDSAELPDLTPVLATPPCPALFDGGSNTLLVQQQAGMGSLGPAPLAHERQPGVHRSANRPSLLAHSLETGDLRVRQDIVGLPMSASSAGVAPFLHSDGWIWLECSGLQLPNELKLSAVLASDEELRSHPWLQPHEVDAILYWRRSTAREDEPWPEHLSGLGWFIRHPAGSGAPEE